MLSESLVRMEKEFAGMIHRDFLEKMSPLFWFSHPSSARIDIDTSVLGSPPNLAMYFSELQNIKIFTYGNNLSLELLTYLVSHESGHHFHYHLYPEMDECNRHARGWFPFIRRWKEIVAESSSLIFLNNSGWTIDDFRNLGLSSKCGYEWSDKFWNKYSGKIVESTNFLRNLLVNDFYSYEILNLKDELEDEIIELNNFNNFF